MGCIEESSSKGTDSHPVIYKILVINPGSTSTKIAHMITMY